MTNSEVNIQDLTFDCLEAARQETVRRLTVANIPTSVSSVAVVVEDSESGGWSTKSIRVQNSSTVLSQVQVALLSVDAPDVGYAFRAELWPLGEYLARHSDLAERPAALRPNLTGVDAILRRYLEGMTLRYFRELPDLAQGDRLVSDRLAVELLSLAQREHVLQTSQLAVDGVRVEHSLRHRAVRIRPLTGIERGLWLSRNSAIFAADAGPVTDFVASRAFSMFTPRSLIEVQATRSDPLQPNPSPLPKQVALAFYLEGYDLVSDGTLSSFDEPEWASFGTSSAPFPVDENLAVDVLDVSESQFRRVVELAYRMPNFTVEQPNSRQVALERALRGFGADWVEYPFLDFAISLEAALLGGATTELAYKFALYGALFLSSDRDPAVTHKQLKNIYSLRSQLVHGGKVKTDRSAALEDARELTRTILHRALTMGWPDPTVLDQWALGGRLS